MPPNQLLYSSFFSLLLLLFIYSFPFLPPTPLLLLLFRLTHTCLINSFYNNLVEFKKKYIFFGFVCFFVHYGAIIKVKMRGGVSLLFQAFIFFYLFIVGQMFTFSWFWFMSRPLGRWGVYCLIFLLPYNSPSCVQIRFFTCHILNIIFIFYKNNILNIFLWKLNYSS